MKQLLFAAILLTQTGVAVLAQNGTISGQLRSASGIPISGVHVAAITAPGRQIVAASTESDSFGRYRFENLPAGGYYIAAGRPDAPSCYPEIRPFMGATVVTVSLQGHL